MVEELPPDPFDEAPVEAVDLEVLFAPKREAGPSLDELRAAADTARSSSRRCVRWSTRIVARRWWRRRWRSLICGASGRAETVRERHGGCGAVRRRVRAAGG